MSYEDRPQPFGLFSDDRCRLADEQAERAKDDALHEQAPTPESVLLTATQREASALAKAGRVAEALALVRGLSAAGWAPVLGAA